MEWSIDARAPDGKNGSPTQFVRVQVDPDRESRMLTLLCDGGVPIVSGEATS
jgi:hypothetical protein